MLFSEKINKLPPLRQAIVDAYRRDESVCLASLLEQAKLPADAKQRIRQQAEVLVAKVREDQAKQGGLDAILQKYDLSSEEGIALMCIAEAMLRIPDTETVDNLLQDKLTSTDWSAHAGKSDSLFANAVTWSLMLTGKIYTPAEEGLGAVLKRLTQRSSGIAIRPAVRKFMEFLGRKFVMGQTIDEALKRAKKIEEQGYRYSYDMLGEAARTDNDARRYFEAYSKAIDAIGQYAKDKGPLQGPGISIKLSALHPRYEFAHKKTVMQELVPRFQELIMQAKRYNIGLTIDAEEADRLDLSLDVIEAVFSQADLQDWEGFGVAVQSYQKRAPYVLDFLADLARQHKRRFKLRLIKGAYWDYEIKVSQEQGLDSYPVFTRKNSTDVSFIACAKKVLANIDAFYPQFATHNAYSIATILELAAGEAFEFQCLHGMGQKVYDHIVGPEHMNIPCRIYAPVGSHEDLLGYLMRRLLENGANTSFINLIANQDVSLDDLLRDPVERVAALSEKPHPNIPLPAEIYGAERKNALGIDLTHDSQLHSLDAAMDAALKQTWQAEPMVHELKASGTYRELISPANANLVVGKVLEATTDDVQIAFEQAEEAYDAWDKTPVDERAACLDKMAELLEHHMLILTAMACREAGKTIDNAISEVREAVDFCRYYAVQARAGLQVQPLPGPTGEANTLFCHGRGTVVCISPWNFPLAIFLGQVTAALVTGNCVLAKPAEQTPLIAAYATQLLYEAGVPTNVLQLLPGLGETIGAALIADPRVAGVMFTGSTEVAKLINQTLAKRQPIVPLIAETGGLNTLIVDSSALPEQVTADVIQSAFDSAGQRCSALRVLYLQDDIADRIIEMLKGAMARLSLGSPVLLSTDIGPVIDREALNILQQHAAKMQQQARLIYQTPIIGNLDAGHFFPPTAFEIDSIAQLEREVFGPILHVIRYKAKDIDRVVDEINATGYGLTLGVHSRINRFAEKIIAKAKVGNIYVNRNVVGAVVGVQPFGGEGLSGTGPKAGGPHYLYRLCTERTVSINTTAAGGNASLLMLSED